MEEIRNSAKIVNFPAGQMKGSQVGLYTNQRRIEGEYERVLAPIQVKSAGRISTLLPAKRSHATGAFAHPEKESLRELQSLSASGRVLETVKETYVPQNSASIESAVYKPIDFEPIKKEDFSKFIYQAERLVEVNGKKYAMKIEKIIHRGEEIFFGIINNQLAKYTISNENGKKEINLQSVEKINGEQNNFQYLEERAMQELSELEKKALQKIKPAYSVNWPNYSEEYGHQDRKASGLY